MDNGIGALTPRSPHKHRHVLKRTLIMTRSEIPLDSSEVGELVGACVPLALTAHADAIVDIIVDAIVGAIDGEPVGAVVRRQDTIPEIRLWRRTQNTRIKGAGRVGRVILSKFESYRPSKP